MQKEISKIKLPKIKDLRGNLTFLEENNHIPFPIKRVYWLYDVPGGENRGGHAFSNTTEIIIPLSGGILVETYCGEQKQNYNLQSTDEGLIIPPMTWRRIGGFLSNSICLVITDTQFKDSKYIRDFNDYIKQFKNKS